MAKAILGYVGGSDPRRDRETLFLKQRIADLESEVRRLKQDNDTLIAAYRQVSLAPVEGMDGEMADLDPIARILQPLAP